MFLPRRSRIRQDSPDIVTKSTIGEVKSSVTWSVPWMTVTVLWSSTWSVGSPPEKMIRGLASVFNHLILVTAAQSIPMCAHDKIRTERVYTSVMSFAASHDNKTEQIILTHDHIAVYTGMGESESRRYELL